MNSPQKVQRITIDEKLSDNLIRILVAGLKPNLKTFDDSPEYWGEEKEFLVNPKDYREQMGMPRAARKWSWRKLYEGEVFLSGGFREISGDGIKFEVDTKQRNFQCIDRVSKERVKRDYLTALEGGS